MDKDPIIKAKQLIELLKYFKNIKHVNIPKEMKCPFDITIGEKFDNLTHYNFSCAAVGTGYIRWDCPFCGKHFED